MLPLAPGRLSTMNCCLSDSESACASWRAYRSVPPPGDEGTMNFTGRAGQVSCAGAGAPVNTRTIPTADPKLRFMAIPPAEGVYPRSLAFARSVAYLNAAKSRRIDHAKNRTHRAGAPPRRTLRGLLPERRHFGPRDPTGLGLP